MAKAREIVEEESASASVRVIEADARLSEVYRALQWRIARDADTAGQEVPGHPGSRIVVSTPTPGFPDVLAVVYTHTPERASIIDMQIQRAGAEEKKKTA